MAEVAVVIPAMDEAATIGSVVSAASAFAAPIVVDDGSSDATGDLALAAGAIVVRHAGNQGYDEALRSGFLRALDEGFDVIACMDGDGQHDAALLAALVEPLLVGRADLTLGIRDGAARISERAFSAYTRRRFGVTDILCGAKAYTAATCVEFQGELGRRSIGTSLALAALRAGRRAAFVPVAIQPRAHGSARFGVGLRSELRIVRAMGEAVWLDLRAAVPRGR